jgi:hypothetical protein
VTRKGLTPRVFQSYRNNNTARFTDDKLLRPRQKNQSHFFPAHPTENHKRHGSSIITLTHGSEFTCGQPYNNVQDPTGLVRTCHAPHMPASIIIHQSTPCGCGSGADERVVKAPVQNLPPALYGDGTTPALAGSVPTKIIALVRGPASPVTALSSLLPSRRDDNKNK